MGKRVALAAEGLFSKNLLFNKTFSKCKFKFEPMSLGSVLSSHDRCVTYNASNLIMVLYSSLKRELTQSTTLWDLRFVLSHVLGTRESLRLKIRKM